MPVSESRPCRVLASLKSTSVRGSLRCSAAPLPPPPLLLTKSALLGGSGSLRCAKWGVNGIEEPPAEDEVDAAGASSFGS